MDQHPIVGQILPSNAYGKFEVIEYIDNRNIKIRFLDTGWEGKTSLSQAKVGSVRDYFFPVWYGVGFQGTSESSKGTIPYRKWIHMIRRCYEEESKNNTYSDKTVCTEWHNFVNFRDWAVEQIGLSFEFALDKDLLVKHNKVYSPDTCVFLPQPINNHLRLPPNRKNNLPMGVNLNTNCFNSYGAAINNIDGKRVYLGSYETAEEAFSVYKVEKEKVLKQIAEKYKSVIDPRAYEALLAYTVEITD